MTTIINASPSNGIVQTADGSGVMKLQSNGVTTNALAWVNFNGTTSPGTIRSSYNISSVTKNGTGDFTLNFATATSDANYCCLVCSDYGSGTNFSTSAPTTTTARIQTYNTTTGGALDRVYTSAAVFGN